MRYMPVLRRGRRYDIGWLLPLPPVSAAGRVRRVADGAPARVVRRMAEAMIRPCDDCGALRGVEQYTNDYGEVEVDYWQCHCQTDTTGGLAEPDYSDYPTSAGHNDHLRGVGYHSQGGQP